MRKMLTLLGLLAVTVIQTASATAVPAPVTNTADVAYQPALQQPKQGIFTLPFLKQLLKKSNNRNPDNVAANQKSKRILSRISLISGILGIVCLATATTAVASFFLAPIAIVTGIIGVNRNQNRKSRIEAIIGISAGAVPVLLIIALLIVLLSWSSNGW